MPDQFEKFVHKHRSQFDSEQANHRVWEGIQKGLDDTKPLTRDFSWLWKVAASIFFILSAYLIYDRSGIVQEAIQNSTELALDTLGREFDTTEGYYITLIAKKSQELRTMPPEDSLMAHEFKADLFFLDSIYQILRTEYGKFNDKKLEEAMILNLQWRIDVLSRQMEILGDVKKRNDYDSTIKI